MTRLKKKPGGLVNFQRCPRPETYYKFCVALDNDTNIYFANQKAGLKNEKQQVFVSL
jgi:hypothetical protein